MEGKVWIYYIQCSCMKESHNEILPVVLTSDTHGKLRLTEYHEIIIDDYCIR